MGKISKTRSFIYTKILKFSAIISEEVACSKILLQDLRWYHVPLNLYEVFVLIVIGKYMSYNNQVLHE